MASKWFGFTSTSRSSFEIAQTKYHVGWQASRTNGFAAVAVLRKIVKRIRQSEGKISNLYGTSSRLHGGASVLVNGAVFKTVSETARAVSGRFDSYTPPPTTII